MGSNVQVCWEKFARYFEVEPRYVPCTPEHPFLSVEEAIARCDEGTIGVAAILGSTYTGQYEPVEELDQAISALNERTGYDIPIHVDAASGGFVAPFIQPEIRWDFRLSNVKSINVSGHKYGLVYPGVGWVVWRDASDLPEGSSSTWSIWAATNQRSTSTSPRAHLRSSLSITTFSGSAGRATAR